MPAKVCVVSFQDGDGTRHTVEVAAETLYEAAAIALNQFRRQELIEDDVAPGPHTRLEVSVKSPTAGVECRAVEGLARGEIILKQRVRSLLEAKHPTNNERLNRMDINGNNRARTDV